MFKYYKVPKELESETLEKVISFVEEICVNDIPSQKFIERIPYSWSKVSVFMGFTVWFSHNTFKITEG